MNPRSRSIPLDVLRALAAMQVILFHLGIFHCLGALGVDLFFVLSGFFISGILFSDIQTYGTIRLSHFWINRAFKILPPLIVLCAFILLFMHDPKTISAVQNALFFCADYRWAGWTLLSHTWSLSVEEQFYLCLPFILILMRNKIKYFPIMYLIVLVGTFILRLQPGTINSDGAVTMFHLRTDNLLTGVMIRWLVDYKPNWFSRIADWSLIPGLFCWLPALGISLAQDNLILHSLMYTLIDISCGTLVIWCYAHDTNRIWISLPTRWLASTGLSSYSIYLWQQPIVSILRWGKSTALPPIIAPIVAFALSIFVGWIMYRLIEIPTMNARKVINQFISEV